MSVRDRTPGVKYATVSELSGNQVLAQLPPRVRDRIAESLRRDVFKPWQLLRDAHQPITRIYFPIDCVISIVALMEDGSIAESYTTGRDGAAGSEIVWGGDRPIFRSMCQIPGVCYSMDAREFRAIAERDPAVMKVVRSYAHCLMSLTGQSAACNLLHELVQRCARWLLISHDRVGKDTFDLTQDVLSTMLGVRRPSVTIAAGTLQKAGLISYTRGRITIADRRGLEEASCECYRVVADEFVRVLGGPVPALASSAP